jgi:hypothetical protein
MLGITDRGLDVLKKKPEEIDNNCLDNDYFEET